MHASIADVIVDIVQNSIEANATHVELTIVTNPDRLMVTVKDNGKGMDATQLKRAFDPFYSEPGKHDKRRVGLGLPLLIQMVEQTGGQTDITSTPNLETTVSFWCDQHHPDIPPLGDLPLALVSLMAYPSNCEISLARFNGNNSYDVTKSELVEALGSLEEPANLTLSRRFFKSQEESLYEEQ